MLACITYVFWTNAKLEAHPRKKTQLDYLRERLEVVYDNLRDLNFEFRAGKYPLSDYNIQRQSLEAEAGAILSRIERLDSNVKFKLTA